jgi:hypothetical protein
MTRAAFLSMIGLGAAGQATQSNGQATHQSFGQYSSPPQPGDSPGCSSWIEDSNGRVLQHWGDPKAIPPETRRRSGIYTHVNGECPCCGTQAPPWKPVDFEAYFSIDGHHVIMCAHCRCVFGQDAEPEK